MMKSKVNKKKNNFTLESKSVKEGLSLNEEKKKESHTELMARLASGQKQTVSVKEMKRMTNKNYENLPEIKKRKDEERKKEEFKQR